MSFAVKILLATLGLVLLAGILVLVRRLRGMHGGGRRGGAGHQPMIAFVLLKDPRMPGVAALKEALGDYPLAAGTVEAMGDGAAVTVSLESGGGVIAMVMDAPVPGGEAESAAERSLASYRGDAALASHGAHLTVTAFGELPGDQLQRLQVFTQVVAAISRASGAIGIYWGAGGVAHTAEFFLDVVKSEDPPISVWVGVSIVGEGADRVSILGSGMTQLQLPDLLLSCPGAELDEGIAYFFDLLAYLAKRGEPLNEGATVGRTEVEEACVAYVPSPIDPEATVWRVELP